MSRRIPRRTLLRGMFAGGAVAVALPWLEAMDPPKASAAPADRDSSTSASEAHRTGDGVNRTRYPPISALSASEVRAPVMLSSQSVVLIFAVGVSA